MYELACHVTLSCSGRRKETRDFLGTKSKWWPADWDILRTARVRAAPEAAVVVANHLYDALKEGHEARECIVRLIAALV